MGADKSASRDISRKYPHHVTSTAVVGDSQMRYVHNHFDPARGDAPAFIARGGAHISDVENLMDFVPRTVTTLVLHVGTCDVASAGADKAIQRFRDLLEFIAMERAEICTVHATLVLPRSLNRRRKVPDWRSVNHFNREASRFNALLRQLSRRTRGLHFIDHGLEYLPARRVLAADGIHPSFEGVALIAGHLHQTILRRRIADTWTNRMTTVDSRDRAPCQTHPKTCLDPGPSRDGEPVAHVAIDQSLTPKPINCRATQSPRGIPTLPAGPPPIDQIEHFPPLLVRDLRVADDSQPARHPYNLRNSQPFTVCPSTTGFPTKF